MTETVSDVLWIANYHRDGYRRNSRGSIYLAGCERYSVGSVSFMSELKRVGIEVEKKMLDWLIRRVLIFLGRY